MKSLFGKKVKQVSVKITEISKDELKNVIGGTDSITASTTSVSGLKITSGKTTAFFHS
jgi:bacteriocin-like protein